MRRSAGKEGTNTGTWFEMFALDMTAKKKGEKGKKDEAPCKQK